jgi:ribonuclease-3
VIDAKSRLQQVSQARFSVTPTYEVLEVSGAGHSPIFTIRVTAGGGVSAVADGRSKQMAQQTAAAEALATIEAIPVELPPPLEAVEGAPDEGSAAVQAPAS